MDTIYLVKIKKYRVVTSLLGYVVGIYDGDHVGIAHVLKAPAGIEYITTEWFMNVTTIHDTREPQLYHRLTSPAFRKEYGFDASHANDRMVTIASLRGDPTFLMERRFFCDLWKNHGIYLLSTRSEPACATSAHAFLRKFTVMSPLSRSLLVLALPTDILSIIRDRLLRVLSF